jgi:hypothetical protein
MGYIYGRLFIFGVAVANRLIERPGAEAEIVAAQRADEALERGDRDEQLVWLRIIRRAIVEMQAAPAGKPN